MATTNFTGNEFEKQITLSFQFSYCLPDLNLLEYMASSHLSSTELRTIPKGSVHRIVVAVHVSGFVISQIWFIHAKLSSSVYLSWNYTGTLLLLHSTLNPILYCWKIDEERQGVKDTIRKVLCR